jgi:acetamidase/formamidase
MHTHHSIPAALTVLALALSANALAAEVKYDPGDNVRFTYCYAHPPALKIKPGDTVITSTRDASNDVFAPTDKTLMNKLDLTKVNPQTGPFYIEGAEPGDTLQVHIDKIDLNREFGWGGAIPYFGLMAPEYKTAMITPPVPDKLYPWRLDKSRKVGTLDMPNSKIGKIEVPLRPFFGTIGTAPAGSAHQVRRHGDHQHARCVQRRVRRHRQNPDEQTRSHQGESADGPLLC